MPSTVTAKTHTQGWTVSHLVIIFSSHHLSLSPCPVLALLCLSLKLQLLKVFIKSSSPVLLDPSAAFDAFSSVKKTVFLIVFLCHWNIFFSLTFLLWILYVAFLYFCYTLAQDTFIQNQKFSWFFFCRWLTSLYLHIMPVISCPMWKGMRIFLMYWKHIPASFLPIFFFLTCVNNSGTIFELEFSLLMYFNLLIISL